METDAYKLLRFVNFKDIPNWSVQYADEADLGFTKKYPMARIGSFLRRYKELVDVKDGITYNRVTVSTKSDIIGNISLRDSKDGKDIGTKKQYRIHKGQFLLSKIDARNGAFGVVPDDADNAIITSNFWAYDVNYTIIYPEFLKLVTKTQRFLDFAEKCSNGTTNRHYLQEDAFLQQQIPLPSMEEQKIILDAYNNKVKCAIDANEYIDNLKRNRNDYLRKELSFEYNKNIHSGLLQFIPFATTSRWDVQFFSSDHIISSQYNTVTIGSSLEFFMQEQKSSLRIETCNYPTDDFHYIGMENVTKDDGSLIDLPIVKGADIKSQTIRIPKGFMIFGKLRPYLNKYWLNDTEYSDIVCSSEFFCFKPKESFNPDFFKYILSSYIIQEQISESMSGARMPRIDEKTFKSIIIPFPPKDVQDRIANYLNSIDIQICELKDSVIRSKKEALYTFNQKLFTI